MAVWHREKTSGRIEELGRLLARNLTLNAPTSYRCVKFGPAYRECLDCRGHSSYYLDMNVAIVGYGRMGREVEKALRERGHTVAVRVDPNQDDADSGSLTDDTLEGADSVIEFSLADAVLDNARVYSSTAVPAVVGTTGWEEVSNEVRSLFESSGAYLWGSNFSIGANLFFDIVEHAARLINNVDVYDILMYEIHHRRKKDSPSGTALTTAQRIVDAVERKRKIVTEKLDRKIEADELHVGSVRGGDVPGIHTVMLDSQADTIEIRHTARGRTGFALGAVLAAEWLCGRKGFYSVQDFIEETLGRGRE